MAEDEAPSRLRTAETDDDEQPPWTVDDFIPPRPVKLGLPFAIATDCELLSPQPPHVPGAIAAVQCGKCSTPFVLNLLRDQVSRCPECKTAYTHALIVAPVDDTASVDAFIETVALANGFAEGEGDGDEPDGDEGDDAGDDDDDDDDDDEGDDAGDDDEGDDDASK
jgi:hypothetical protein